MKGVPVLFSSGTRNAILAAACFGAVASTYSQPIPPSTAIPVVLTRSVAAGQSKPGDVVSAKTIQTVFFPDGHVLPAGTALTGHVVASVPIVFDSTPYATQNPSVLSIHFDSIAANGSTIPVILSARAIAGPVASHEATIPRYADESDWSGTLILIGGETTAPLERTVQSSAGDATGYKRKEGIFARLLSASSINPDSDARCEATNTEQSVGIFSADACGAYGLNTVSLIGNGIGQDGTFVLESHQRSVQLYAGTTALLQVMPL